MAAHPPPLPERRRTNGVQKITVGLGLSSLVGIATLAFNAGGQAKKWDMVADTQQVQGQSLQQVQTTTSQLSGQILQLATTSNVSQLEARTQVLETKQALQEQLMRDMRADLIERLKRIETKLDQDRVRR
jgi:hypothetical protein